MPAYFKLILPLGLDGNLELAGNIDIKYLLLFYYHHLLLSSMTLLENQIT